MNALTIGGATLDTIIAYEKMETIEVYKPENKQSYLLLKEGAKIEVTMQKCFSGGGGTNTAVSFKRLGFNVRFFGKVGRDNSGHLLLQELQSQGIDTSGVGFSEKFGTATSYVVPSLKKDRIIFNYRGANYDLLTGDLPVTAIQEADFVYVTSLSKTSSLQLIKIIELAVTCNTPVVVNPGSNEFGIDEGFIKKALNGIDILIMNYDEAKKFMSSLLDYEYIGSTLLPKKTLLKTGRDIYQDNLVLLKQFFHKTLTLGPRIVIITDGSNGVHVATRENLYFHPALKVDSIVNTLGAGDAFGSSFCGAVYLGKTIETALGYGVVNSASVIQFHDAKSGLLAHKEILKRLSCVCIKPKVMSW